MLIIIIRSFTYLIIFLAVDRIVSFFDLPHRCFSRVWLLHSWGTGGSSGSSLPALIMTRDDLVLLTHSLTHSQDLPYSSGSLVS